MAYEKCPECGAEKHQLVRCPECGFQRRAPEPKKQSSIMAVERFVEGCIRSRGADDIDAVAVIGSHRPGPVLGLIFEIKGKWIYANDYALSEDDLVEVNPQEGIVIIWKRK